MNDEVETAPMPITCSGGITLPAPAAAFPVTEEDEEV